MREKDAKEEKGKASCLCKMQQQINSVFGKSAVIFSIFRSLVFLFYFPFYLFLQSFYKICFSKFFIFNPIRFDSAKSWDEKSKVFSRG